MKLHNATMRASLLVDVLKAQAPATERRAHIVAPYEELEEAERIVVDWFLRGTRGHAVVAVVAVVALRRIAGSATMGELSVSVAEDAR